VKAIVLRINSPGGATLASDLIWREIKLAESRKPVIISFGNVAASGGYYVATAASRILASPSTLTGSIGIVGGKFSIRDLLSKIGITTDAVEKGASSGYASATRPFTEVEAENIREQMKDFYEELFLPKVADNRGNSIEEVRRLAEGRVWTGAQAYSNGLIDGIGNLQDAVEMARELVGLAERKSRLLTYVQRRSLLDLFPFQMSQPLQQEHILALMPEDFEIS
jgi:protease-4